MPVFRSVYQLANCLEEKGGDMSSEGALEEVIAKWLAGLEWGNEAPEQLDLFEKRR